MQADLLQAGLYAVALLALAIPLGWYMARVFAGEIQFFAPLERAVLGLAGDRREQNWKAYASSLLLFNAAGFALLFASCCSNITFQSIRRALTGSRGILR